MAVLAQLGKQETYGFGLAEALKSVGLDVSTGTLYPLLSRLELEGALTSRLVASDQGPARKYYRLTTQGRQRLTVQTVQWRALSTSITPLIEGVRA